MQINDRMLRGVDPSTAWPRSRSPAGASTPHGSSSDGRSARLRARRLLEVVRPRPRQRSGPRSTSAPTSPEPRRSPAARTPTATASPTRRDNCPIVANADQARRRRRRRRRRLRRHAARRRSGRGRRPRASTIAAPTSGRDLARRLPGRSSNPPVGTTPSRRRRRPPSRRSTAPKIVSLAYKLVQVPEGHAAVREGGEGHGQALAPGEGRAQGRAAGRKRGRLGVEAGDVAVADGDRARPQR